MGVAEDVWVAGGPGVWALLVFRTLVVLSGSLSLGRGGAEGSTEGAEGSTEGAEGIAIAS